MKMDFTVYNHSNPTTGLQITDSTTRQGGNLTQHVFERHSLTEFMQYHCPAALAVDRYITPLWYAIGITGNIICAKIWMTKQMRKNNSSAVYLATLSITDMIFLLLHIAQELQYAWDVNSLGHKGVCELYFPFILAAQYLSPLLVLGFTVERWIAVCKPFQKEKYCTTKRAVSVVVCLVTFSILLSAIQAYFWTYREGIGCDLRTSILWTAWSWTTEMLIFLVVPVIILCFNILVIIEVRNLQNKGQVMLSGQIKQSSNTSAATTVMLLSVSFYVIFTTLPATLVYVLVFQEGDPFLTDAMISQDATWQRYLSYITCRKFIEEICLSHYACNIFLYFITGQMFRTAFLQMFKCPVYFKSKNGNVYRGISPNGKASVTQTTKV